MHKLDRDLLKEIAWKYPADPCRLTATYVLDIPEDDHRIVIRSECVVSWKHCIRDTDMIPTHRAPTEPGEILLEEFLRPLAG
ncbi:hypothetical protein BH23CHL2_BH23CHL2_26610 [soil metagenome]